MMIYKLKLRKYIDDSVSIQSKEETTLHPKRKCVDCGSGLIEERKNHLDYGNCLTCDSENLKYMEWGTK
jgi:hypothetical protein